jgi:hypothetical protein
MPQPGPAGPEKPRVTVRIVDDAPPPPAAAMPPPGWYPDPTMAQTQRYWDGAKWGDHVAPMQNTTASTSGSSALLVGVILAAGAIGFIMSIQSASLLTGTGTIWTGVAIVVGAGILGFIVKAPTWVRVLVGIAVLVSIANAVSVEQQLDEKRQEINNIIQP